MALEASPWHNRDYSYSYWKYGWRAKQKPDILTFLTGWYTLSLDLANLHNLRYTPRWNTGKVEQNVDRVRQDEEQQECSTRNPSETYTAALNDDHLLSLAPMDSVVPLRVEVTGEGITYRLRTCQASLHRDKWFALNRARLCESGKIVQHYDFLGLVLEQVGDLDALDNGGAEEATVNSEENEPANDDFGGGASTQQAERGSENGESPQKSIEVEESEEHRFETGAAEDSSEDKMSYNHVPTATGSTITPTFQGDATLDIVAWPRTFALTLTVTPPRTADDDVGEGDDDQPPSWPEGSTVFMKFQDWEIRKKLPTGNTAQSITLTCELVRPSVEDKPATSLLVSSPMRYHQDFDVTYDPKFQCFVAHVNKPIRDFQQGYKDIRNYDRFRVVITKTKNVEQEGDGTVHTFDYTPFLLELRPPANPTGLVPMICDTTTGVPTGIPVQISKNWHGPGNTYLRAYALLPANVGTPSTEYEVRISYGFYGTVPSASHAQLSLIGYGDIHRSGTNGRWEQLAIGCWGETFCLDMDQSLVPQTITDSRLLMVGEDSKWQWSDAGWGGDWLRVTTSAEDRRLFMPSRVRTAYVSHGPCLTEVQYSGRYGYGPQDDTDETTEELVPYVHFHATVRTLRTDDYARVFHMLKYTFHNGELPCDYLFKMGTTPSAVMPRFVYGNKDGLIEDLDETAIWDSNEQRRTLTSPGPWWVGFPGMYFIRTKKGGVGWKGLIIQSYCENGVEASPSFELRVAKNKEGKPKVDLWILPPLEAAVTSISLTLEWINLPHNFSDYYGPNEPFRQHLKELDNPTSAWQTLLREAFGNDLVVEVTRGGVLKESYPIVISAVATAGGEGIHFWVRGGVGYVPVRFEGLSSRDVRLFEVVIHDDAEEALEEALDQSVHGNDFWQVDFVAETSSYSVAYNLPLDGKETSEWILSPRT